MDSLIIQTAQNGYTVSEYLPHTASNPYVFETFDHLVEWLRDNLEKPKSAQGE
jgi:hypothetical protein